MKWITSAIFIACACWAFFAFTGCGLTKKNQRCHNTWTMPDGAVCRYKESHSSGHQLFSQCANGREYLDPVWWTPGEVCE